MTARHLPRSVLHAPALAALAMAPLFVDPYYLGVLTRAIVAASLALTLHLLVNYAGLVSLAHAAFYGTGAYTVGLLAKHFGVNNLWLSLATAMVAGAVVATVFGLISLRTTGVSFIMITLALGAMLWTLVDNMRSLTGGDEGILGIRAPSFDPLPFVPDRALASFWLATVVLVLTALGLWTLYRSPFGRVLIGIRDSPVRMGALGYRIRAHQLLAFVLCGSAAAVPGVVSAYHNRFVSPSDMDLLVAVGAMVAVVLGQHALFGPAYAAIALALGTEFLRDLTPRWQSVLGAILVAAAYLTLRERTPRSAIVDESGARSGHELGHHDDDSRSMTRAGTASGEPTLGGAG